MNSALCTRRAYCTRLRVLEHSAAWDAGLNGDLLLHYLCGVTSSTFADACGLVSTH